MIGRGREYEERLHPPPDLMRKKVSSRRSPRASGLRVHRLLFYKVLKRLAMTSYKAQTLKKVTQRSVIFILLCISELVNKA